MIGRVNHICLLMVLAAAAWMDIRTKRVSNYLIVFGLCLGFVLNLGMYGWMGILFFFIRIIVPVLVFYLFFLMRVLGAGDIKLFSVVCGLIGIRAFTRIVVYSFLSGAACSMIILLYNRNLFTRLMYAFDYIKIALITKSIPRYDYESDGKQNVIPFSAAIFAGYMIYLLV